MLSIDALLQDAVKVGKIPAVAVTVTNSEKTIYQGGFGYLGNGLNSPIDEYSIFRIASMTKPVCAAAILLLVEEGKINLDDPISRWFPKLENPEVLTYVNKTDGSYRSKRASREISIRHLLSHSSGLGYRFANETLHRLFQKTGKLPIDLPLLHEPGTAWNYGMGYQILGDLIEKITQCSLEDFFREKLFDPLGMEDTFYILPEHKSHRLTAQYQRENGLLKEVSDSRKHETFISGSGGLLSTAADFIRFCRMLLNRGRFEEHRILSEISVREMMKNQIGALTVTSQNCPDPSYALPFPDAAGKDKFGLGMQISMGNLSEKNYRFTGSCSWSGLYNTHFWIDPTKGLSAVFLVQLLPFYDRECMRVFRDFEVCVYGELST